MDIKSESYQKYVDGIFTFDEAFEGMTPSERYCLLNAQNLEVFHREKMIADFESEKVGLQEAIRRYKAEMESHINRLEKGKNCISRILEDSKKNLKKYAHVLEVGYPKE